MNRFDKPVEGQYVSLYVPIPFEQLYQLGKYYNEEVDKAQLELASSVNKWSEFRSPSAIDTKQWYDYTIGGAKLIVDDMVNNPDLIKTAEGRSRITSFINSRPYDKLSNLQLSREAMLQRLKANLELMLKGKYNPLWHDVNFTDYNTSGEGIFKDISPLAYQSMQELIRPYEDVLKPEYIRRSGMYDIKGISKERARKAVDDNMSEILSTPEMQKHLEVLGKQGISKDQVVNYLYNSAERFAWEDQQVNELAKIQEEYRQRRALQLDEINSQQQSDRPAKFTEEVAITAMDKFNEGINNYGLNLHSREILELNAKAAQYLKIGNIPMATQTYKKVNSLLKDTRNFTPNTVFRDILSTYKNENNQITHKNFKLGVNDIINQFTVPVVSSQFGADLAHNIPGITKDSKGDVQSFDTGYFYETPLVSNTRNLKLVGNEIAKIANYGVQSTVMTKVQQLLENGELDNVVFDGAYGTMALPQNKNGNVEPNTAILSTISIPEETLIQKGLTPKQLSKEFTKVVVRLEVRENKNSATGTVNRSGYKDRVFWKMDVMTGASSPKDRANASTLDNKMDLRRMSSTAYTELYPSAQKSAY